MKKNIITFVYFFLSFNTIQLYAQIDFNDSLAVLKYEQKSMYERFYQRDSIISTSLDPDLTFPWQSPIFKKNTEVLDSLNTRMKVDKFEKGFYISSRFPKGTSQEDAYHYTFKIISYKLLNEQNKQIRLQTNKMYSLINTSYHYLDPPTRYIFWIRFIAASPAKTYKGYVEYDVIAPLSFDTTIITKTDTGQTITLNKKKYSVLAFTKNYIALKPLSSFQEIDFKFIGTDNSNKKFLPKLIQKQGYRSGILRSSFTIPEEMYIYFTTHTNLSAEEIDSYVEEYHKRLKKSTSDEPQILIIKDMGYIDKMICYWPNAYTTKRIKKTIDLQ